MSAPEVTSYRFGPFKLVPQEQLLYCQGEPVPLTPKAFETLRVLVERHGRLVTKEDLLREVWPDVVVEENNLAQHISMLRRTLAQAGANDRFIDTVPKRGYRFVAPVAEDRESGPIAVPAIAPSEGPATPSERGPGDPVRTHIRARWAVAAAALAVVALAGFAWDSRNGGSDPAPPREAAVDDSTPRRLAVLPFVNLGPADSGYLADGTVEELTTRLATLDDLGVISTTSTREYDRRGKTVKRIGADLGAAYIIEGSVRWDGQNEGVRIIPRMIRVADDVTVWTRQYDVKLSEMESAHADMTRRIGDALKGEAAIAGESLTPRPFADSEAYLAYLRGVSAFQQSQSDTSLQALARRELEFAVAREPQAAVAWSWLARVYAAQYIAGAQRIPEVRTAALDAAKKALALAPELPEAHLAMARVLGGDEALRELELARRARPTLEGIRIEAWLRQARGEWSQALALYMKGFDLEPAAIADLLGVHYLHLRDYPNAARYLAVSRAANQSAATVPEAWLRFSHTGDLAGARDILEPALALKTPDARVRGLLARYEWFDGRYDRALALIQQMDPAGAWLAANFRFPAAIAMGQVYESMGQEHRARAYFADALQTLQAAAAQRPDDYQTHAGIGLAAAGLRQADLAIRHGRRAAEQLTVSQNAVTAPVLMYVLSTIYARLGQHAEAFATLDRMFAEPGFYSEQWIDRDPWFASLRSDPAYAAHRDRWARRKADALLRP